MRRLTRFGFLAMASLLTLGDSPTHHVAAEERAVPGDSVGGKVGGPVVKAFMRKKLVGAGQIMEGMMTFNNDLIRSGATTMILMSKEAMWAKYQTPSYAQDSADFVRAAERLIKLAEAKDLEGASLTYAQLTIQCVKCHQRVRTQRVVTSRLPASVQYAAKGAGKKERQPETHHKPAI